MSFFDGIKRQLRSVIEWDDPSPGLLFYRWTDNGDEIKNSSKLIVGPGQGCLFVYEGRIEGLFEEEIMVDLKTENIPFLTTVAKVMQSFKSEHQVGIYFFRTTEMLNQKWGTTSSIKYMDPVYKFPVDLRAYGNFSFRISKPKEFFANVIGGSNYYTADNFRKVMSDRILHPLSDYLAEKKYSYVDIDSYREEIAAGMLAKLDVEFSRLGFTITDFRIEGTSFDDATLKRINRIADLTAEGRAASEAGVHFSQLQQLEAMRDAAKNEGGAAGMGMSLGAGVSLGRMMAGGMNQSLPHNGDPLRQLEKLKQMFEERLISESEYAAKKAEILGRL